MGRRRLDRKRRQLQESCDIYVTFVGWVCLGSCLVFGWPMLVVWFALRAVILHFVDVMLDHPTSSPGSADRSHGNPLD